MGSIYVLPFSRWRLPVLTAASTRSIQEIVEAAMVGAAMRASTRSDQEIGAAMAAAVW